MSKEYNGVIIPKTVTIIMRAPRNYYSSDVLIDAYVAFDNDARQLQTGREWSRTYKDGKQVYGQEFTLENKDFVMSLSDSASNSSQGGKLSFWQCAFKKDDVEFRTAINQDLLVSLLKDCDMTKGELKQHIMFCRQTGRLGACFEGSSIHKDYLEDCKTRDAVKHKTSTYKPGDIVSTLTTKQLYLGTLYRYAERDYSWDYRHYSKEFKKITPSELVHVFIDYKNEPEQELYLSFYNMLKTKPARSVIGHCDNIRLEDCYEYTKKYEDHYNKTRSDMTGVQKPITFTLQYGFTKDKVFTDLEKSVMYD